MAVVEAALMTTEQLLALPDDGVERWLIRGQLREKPAMVGHSGEKIVTIRNRWHSRIMAQSPSSSITGWISSPRRAAPCCAARRACG